MVRRIWALFNARNKEFYRDRATLAWNFAFPFLILVGFSVMFDGRQQNLYKVGVLGPVDAAAASAQGGPDGGKYSRFLKETFVEFLSFDDRAKAIDKLAHHKIDFLIDPKSQEYWVSKSSPKGHVVERLFQASLGSPDRSYKKSSIIGREIPYAEWLFPGILGMNMMFNALFGVGYSVVLYRKNGVLKRMSVTPLHASEFLLSQVISRMVIMLCTTLIVFVGSMLAFGFECRGSYVNLAIIFALGGFSLVSIGLLVACRSRSEEFASGMLNLITWPMMLLSEVWFSLEGVHPWVQRLSKLFPLTHLISGIRKIMNDGAGLYDLRVEVAVLAITSVVFLALGSYLFKWQKS